VTARPVVLEFGMGVDVHGLDSGSAHLQKTIVPIAAEANVSIRLAPGQDTEEIAAAFERLLRAAVPPGAELEVTRLATGDAGLIDPESQAVQLGLDAFERVLGVRPRLVRGGGTLPIVPALAAKGIPTIVAHLYDEHQPSAPNVGAVVNIPYNVAGQLIADHAIVDTNGKTDALVVTINQVKSTVPMVAGVKAEFAKYCQGCKLSFTDVTIADIATKIQPNVQGALTADPNINYVICLYDSAEAPFAEAAIRAAGRVGKVKISTFNGTPTVLKDVKSGAIVTMDVGENLEWIGYAIVDQSMRIMGGLPTVKSEHVPVRVFDKSNIAQAGSSFTSGWGNSYIGGYQKLWGLK